MRIQEFHDWLTLRVRRTLIMGVINVTPDSFSDGGRFRDTQHAVDAAVEMADAGADWIDIGAESTRPGSTAVSEQEQLRRAISVLSGVRGRIPTLISIDTTRSAVAEEALKSGANVINDISAGRDDSDMLPLAARYGVAIILMHMLGAPATMQINPYYDDVTREVGQFLTKRRQAAVQAGVDHARILLDPGIGFGKNTEHNLQLLRDTEKLAGLGSPLVVGASRKGFIGKVTGRSDPADRVYGTAAVVAWCVANGAGVVRVHDVAAMTQVVQMSQAITTGNASDFLNG